MLPWYKGGCNPASLCVRPPLALQHFQQAHHLDPAIQFRCRRGPETYGNNIQRLLPEPVILPVRNMQLRADLHDHKPLWRDIGQIDDVVEHISILRLVPQDRDCLVQPVHHAPGEPHTLNPVLQPVVVQVDLCVYQVQERIKVMQRGVQLLCDGVRKALQHPSDIPVAPKQKQRVMVHVTALFLVCLANRLIPDRIVLDEAALGQHLHKRMGLHGQLAFLLGIDIPCLHQHLPPNTLFLTGRSLFPAWQ